jgi:uncharacterized protein
VGLSAIFWFLIIRAGTMAVSGGAYVYALMWCPGAAAILASLLTGRRVSAIGWRWSWKWALLGYLIPVAYAAVAYGSSWALGLAGVPNADFLSSLTRRFGGSEGAAFTKFVLLQGTVGVFVACLSGLGEEIGWRGFLVPELARKTGFTRTALVSGAIWAVWHYPILLFADYNAGTPAWYGLTCFTVSVLGIGFVFAYARLVSGSIWPAAILHGSHNLWIQGVFTPLTRDTGRTRWVIDEFGAALAVSAVGVAWLTWRLRGRIPPVGAAS